MLEDVDATMAAQPPAHRTRRLVMMGDTDASGLIYFPIVSRWLAETFEPWIGEVGQSLREQIDSGHAMPNVRTEVDIRAPLGVGDTVDIELRLAHVGTHSFRFSYRMRRNDGVIAIEAATHHVWVRLLETATAAPPRIEKAPVPGWLRALAGAGPRPDR